MPMMAISTGASLLGATEASNAAGGAADLLKVAAKSAYDNIARGYQYAGTTLQNYYDQAAGFLSPYVDIGTSALRSYADLYGLPGGGGGPEGGSSPEAALAQFRASPEYQLPLQEGLKAVEYSRAAAGGLRNPVTARALQNYGQTYASTRLDSYLSRLMQLAGMGQSAATTQGANAINVGSALGRLKIGEQEAQSQGVLGAAQAAAAGRVAQGNIWSGAITGIGNNLATLVGSGSLGGWSPGGTGSYSTNPSVGSLPGIGTFYPGYTGTPVYGSAPATAPAVGYTGWPAGGTAAPYSPYLLNYATG